jgi:hypothetical protein
MDWDYSQSEKDENGEWQDCLYKCDFVLEKVRRGISELINNRAEYEQYSPENGYGTLDGAIRCLKSLETCIFETAEETGIPLDKIYMSW